MSDDSKNDGSSDNGDGGTWRDEKGRFTPGNRYGPGRPKLKVEREYLEALTGVVSIEDWKVIVRKAVADAKGGDDKARAWLAKYCLGKSPPSLMELKVKDESGLTAAEEVRQELDKSKNIETRMREYCELIGIEHDRSL